MRVFAIRSMKDGVCYSYGQGELIEKKVPDAEPFNKINLKNPCIKLDTGKYVWGFECWWGKVERFEEEYKPKIKETVMVEPDNILPVDEK